MRGMYVCAFGSARQLAVLSVEPNHHKNNTNKPTVKQEADLAECFRQVPPVFFSRDFELADPAMFEALVVKATPDSQVRKV